MVMYRTTTRHTEDTITAGNVRRGSNHFLAWNGIELEPSERIDQEQRSLLPTNA